MKNPIVMILLACCLMDVSQVVAQDEEGSSAPNAKTFATSLDLLGAVNGSVNLYSGKVNLPIPLVELSGRNGLDVSVGLLYNGVGIPYQMGIRSLEAPTSIVGMGWTLGQEQIIVDHKGTGSRHDDSYYLVGGGATTRLIAVAEDDGVLELAAESYQFWRIRYHQNDELWEITREDGSKSIYGGGVTLVEGQKQSDGHSVQWGVRWGNWIGNSIRVSGQEQFATAWSLHRIEDRSGNHILFHYRQVQQYVGNSSGKLYTQAIYLDKIVDTYGREVVFHYDDKYGAYNADPETTRNALEYEEAHVISISATQPTPDAYQDRFEQEYLAQVEVKGIDSGLMLSIDFDYELTDTTGNLVKRQLTSLTHRNADGEAIGSIRFTYEPGGSAAGLLKSVTHPGGAITTYTYASQQVVRSKRDVTVENTNSGSDTPLVYLGDDYAVVGFYRPSTTTNTLFLYPHVWDGEWVRAEGVEHSINVGTSGGMLDFEVFAGKSYFVLFEKYHVNSGTKRVILYRRDYRHRNVWLRNEYVIGTADKQPDVVLGDNFFSFSLGDELHRITFKNDHSEPVHNVVSLSNLFGSIQLSMGFELAGSKFVTGGQGNFLIVGRLYKERKSIDPEPPYFHQYLTNTFINVKFLYINRFGEWMASDEDLHQLYTEEGQSSIYQINQYTWAIGQTMAVFFQKDNGKLANVINWDEEFENQSIHEIELSPDNSGNPDAAVINNQFVGARSHRDAGSGSFRVGRYDGLNWHFDSFGQNHGGYLIGDDYAVKFNMSNEDFYRISFNTNSGNQYASGNWQTQNIGATAGNNTRPTAGLGFLAYARKVYTQGRDNGFELAGELGVGLASGNTQSCGNPTCNVYAGYSGYITYKRTSMSGTPNYSLGVSYLKNGQLQLGELLSGENFAGMSFRSVNGNTIASQLNKVIYLYRRSGDQFSGRQNDVVVSKVEVNDGFEVSRTHYTYNVSTATFSLNNETGQYHAVSVTSSSSSDETNYGMTRQYFYNGFTKFDLMYPDTLDYRLKGLNYVTEIRDAHDKLVSLNTNSAFNITNVSLNPVASGWYARPLESSSTTDNLTIDSNQEYTLDTGLLAASQSSHYDGSGVSRTYRTEYTYFHEKYESVATQLNLLTPVIQTVSKVGATVLSSEITQWKDWGGTIGWQPLRTAVWDGTGAIDNINWTSMGALPSNWIQTHEITKRHAVYGWVTETKDISGIHSSIKWSSLPQQVVARFSNAADNTTLGENFDRLQLDGGPVNWSLPQTHNWSLAQGHLRWMSTANEGWISVSETIGQANFIAEYDIHVPPHATSTNWGAFHFRKTSLSHSYSQSGYSVRVRRDGRIQLTKLSATVVGEATIPDFADKPWYRVQVHAEGNHFQVFVNGKRMIQATDTSYPTGTYLGFYGFKANVRFDNLLVHPIDAIAQSSGYDPVYGHGVSQSGGGVTTRAMYDSFQRPVATIGIQGALVSTSNSYLSRDHISPAYPNVSHSTSVRGKHDFYDDFSISTTGRWSAQGDTSSKWSLWNGRLKHTNSGGIMLGSYRLDLGRNYTGRVVIELDIRTATLSGSPDPNFSIGMGSATWGYGTNSTGNAVYAAFSEALSTWRIRAHTGSWTMVKGGLEPLRTYRIKIVADLGQQKSSFYIDGVPVAHNLNFRGSNIQSIRRIALFNSGNGDSTEWHIDNVLVYTDPIHTVSYLDGAGRLRQSQAEDSTSVIISATHYDGLGRAAVNTRPVRLNGEWFGYRTNFSTYNWSTNQMTGDIVSIDNATYGNYPFWRTRFESSPLSRQVESGTPGELFSIGEMTPKTEYFVNRDDGFMDHLPDGKYRQTYSEDADGTVNTTLYDAAGNVLGKAMVLQRPVHQTSVSQLQPVVSLHTHTNPAGSFLAEVTGQANYTVFAPLSTCDTETTGPCPHTFLLKVGNAPGNSFYESFQITSGEEESDSFDVTAGNTYYLTLEPLENLNYAVGAASVTYQVLLHSYDPGVYDYLTTYEYDLRGDLTQIRPPNYYDPPTGSASQFVTEYEHDHFGRVVWQKDPDAGVSRSIYDRLGRLRFSQNAANAAAGVIQYSKYDDLGRVVESGYLSQTWNQGTLQSHAENAAWPSTPSTWRVKTTYGTAGADRGAVAKVQVNNDSDNLVDVTETWFRDASGRVAAKGLELAGQGPAMYVSYVYNNLGNVVQVLYPDANPLVISEIYINSANDQDSHDNAGEYIEVVNISDHDVDLKGWTLRDIGGDSDQFYTVETSHVVQPGGTAIFANNYNNRYSNVFGATWHFDLSSVWHRLRLQNWPTDDVIALQDPTGRTVDWVAWNGTTYEGTSWTLNPADDETISFHRKAVVAGPGLKPLPAQWEAGSRDPGVTSRLTSIDRRGDVTYSHNRLGQISAVGTPDDHDFYAAYTYHASGALASESLHRGDVARSYTYNSAGWLTALGGDYFTQTLTYTSGGYGGDSYHTGMIASSTYGYSWSSPDTLYPNAPAGYSYAYRYDARGQLVTADHSTDTDADVGVGTGKTLQYDPNGNMTRYNRGNTTRTYTYTSGSNRFEQSPERLNTYDASGRITAIDGHALGYQSFQIDPYWGKAVRIAGDQTVAYRYGATGQRVGSTLDPDGSAPQRTTYVHGLGSEPLIEFRNHGTHPVTRYVYGPTGLLAIHEDEEGTVWFPVKDNLGTTRVMLQTKPLGSGRQVNAAAYSDYLPFGEPMRAQGSGAGRFGFTGQEYDAETDLHNYKARLYSAETGQFQSPDPAGQFHSPYVGMGNNPVNLVDPDGEVAVLVPYLVAGAVGGGINLYTKYRQGKINNFGDVAKSFGVGFVAGVVSTWGGGAAFAAGGGLIGASGAGGFVAGFGGGFVGSFGSSLTLSIGNHIAFGDPMMSGRDIFLGSMIGGGLGGTFNGIAALRQGRSFFNGNVRLDPVSPNGLSVATLNRPLNSSTTTLSANSPSPRDIPGARQLGDLVDDGPVPFNAVRLGGGEVNILPDNYGKLPMQMHHFATNKHSQYTPQMASIARDHGLSLGGSWNTSLMPHLGRHPHAYHDYVLNQMIDAASKSGGNQAIFLQIYNVKVKQYTFQNPHLLRKSGW